MGAYKTYVLTLMVDRKDNYEREISDYYNSLEESSEEKRAKTNILIEKAFNDLSATLLNIDLIKRWIDGKFE